MTPALSLYLDVVRFSAALAVYLAHVSKYPFTLKTVCPGLGLYGDIAVIVFFLLSGYVIAYVVATREKSAALYFGNRVARLYSVVLVALLLTFVFDCLGKVANPDFYHFSKVLLKPASWSGYISSVFFLNEFQVLGLDGIAPGTNGPYWSLSFEATYYLVAGIVMFAPRVIGIPIALLVLALAGRTIIALFPVWILGYLVYHYHARYQSAIQVWAARLLFVSTAGAVMMVPYIADYLPVDNFGHWFPWGVGPFNRNLPRDYIVAVAFALHLISAKAALPMALEGHAKFQATIRWLGSLTFLLYCIHYPAICFFAAISPWGVSSYLNLFFISSTTMLLVIAFSPVCDALKQAMRIRRA